jgi:hypothetical protein
MGQLLNDSVLIIGFLAIVPRAIDPRSRYGARRCRLETPHVSLLCLRCMVLNLPFKSVHCACSVGMRDGLAHEPQSTACVKH